MTSHACSFRTHRKTWWFNIRANFPISSSLLAHRSRKPVFRYFCIKIELSFCTFKHCNLGFFYSSRSIALCPMQFLMFFFSLVPSFIMPVPDDAKKELELYVYYLFTTIFMISLVLLFHPFLLYMFLSVLLLSFLLSYEFLVAWLPVLLLLWYFLSVFYRNDWRI